ncbi:MAG: response regulator transcription factor [Chitinophagaceae bacterium]|nr:response regulator transcription factor [Chitinophagaceae bacterium]MCW5929777.1 response regulator transcription factor [Chitinophagaceae bacterium]
MIKCVVVDDEPLAVSLLSRYIRQYDGIELMDGFSDGLESIEYINSNKVDLLFLDILMPDITGISLLQKLEHKPVVIFTSAHRDFAVDGYEIGIADYLLKPFDYNRFAVAVQRAIERIRLKEEGNPDLAPGVFVRSEYQTVKISFQDILYAESLDDYIRIHLTESRSVITLISLKSFLTKLPAEDFVRVHRRYIISINKIHSIGTKKIILKGNVEIPVGDTYLSKVQYLRSKL